MADLFTLKITISFFVGAIYTLFATIAADKMGPKIGGLISGLPSTVLFGLLFIGWTQNTEASVEATTLIPAIIGVACLFVIAYIYFVKKGFWPAIFVAMLVWSVATYVLILAQIKDFTVSLTIFVILFVVGHIVVTRFLTIPPFKANKIIYTSKLLLVRGFISGSVIALSVIMAKTGGPVIGGIFSAFPAALTSTLFITYKAHGAGFSASVAKNILFAWISTTIFVLAARYTFEPFGLILGSLISLLICYISAYAVYTIISKRH